MNIMDDDIETRNILNKKKRKRRRRVNHTNNNKKHNTPLQSTMHLIFIIKLSPSSSLMDNKKIRPSINSFHSLLLLLNYNEYINKKFFFVCCISIVLS